MDIKDIKEGKTFYRLRITSAGQIYELNMVNINAIRGNIECIFQINYSIHNSDFSYTSLYERLYVEEYLTLPNKQALMKAVRAQIMGHSFYQQLKPINKLHYINAMRLIKQLH